MRKALVVNQDELGLPVVDALEFEYVETQLLQGSRLGQITDGNQFRHRSI